MRVNYVEVEIESVYDKSTARIKLSPDDVAGLIALAERLKLLQPEKRASGSGGSVPLNEYLLRALPDNMRTATGMRDAQK